VFNVPGSKSVAQRALVRAALNKTCVVLKNVPDGDDVHSLMDGLSKCGVKFVNLDDGVYKVCGAAGAQAEAAFDGVKIFVGHGGTPLRFLVSFLCSVPGVQEIDGSDRLRQRPIKPLVDALRFAGADIVGDRLPLKIGYASLASTIKIDSGLSSQFLTSLLLSADVLGLREIEVVGKKTSLSYVDLTKKVLADFGLDVVETDFGYEVLEGRARLNDYYVESDWASAGYLIGASVLKKRRARIAGLSLDSLQPDYGVLSVFKRMGMSVKEVDGGLEFFADELKSPGSVDCAFFPDSAQTIAVLAAFCDGEITELKGLETLPFKECDRLRALQSELKKLGIKTEITSDSIKIYGGNPRTNKSSLKIETFNDHRMAMAFGMLKPLFSNLEFDDESVVSKSFPGFWREIDKLLV